MALGNQPGYRILTSATLHRARRRGHPARAHRLPRHAGRQSIENAFAARLRSLGVPTTLVDARTLTHGQVSNRIGAPGDTVMTPAAARLPEALPQARA